MAKETKITPVVSVKKARTFEQISKIKSDKKGAKKEVKEVTTNDEE